MVVGRASFQAHQDASLAAAPRGRTFLCRAFRTLEPKRERRNALRAPGDGGRCPSGFRPPGIICGGSGTTPAPRPGIPTGREDGFKTRTVWVRIPPGLLLTPSMNCENGAPERSAVLPSRASVRLRSTVRDLRKVSPHTGPRPAAAHGQGCAGVGRLCRRDFVRVQAHGAISLKSLSSGACSPSLIASDCARN